MAVTRKKPAMCKLAVAVAKDTLKLINTKNSLLEVDGGTYLTAFCDRDGKKLAIYELLERPRLVNSKAQDVLQKRTHVKKCRACAIGSLFVAHVMRHDGMGLHDFVHMDQDGIRERLSDAFTEDELRDLEDSFYDEAIPMAEHFDKPSMIRICNNIIRNKGRFVRGQEEKAFAEYEEERDQEQERADELAAESSAV